MPCTYVVVIWCLLTITIQTVYTYDDKQFLVNYGMLHTKIDNSKSIFMYHITDGSKIDLKKWLPTVRTMDDEYDITNTKIMYKFIKCECADYIKTATKDISGKITNVTTKTAKETCEMGIRELSYLEKQIAHAITTLLAISDDYTNLLLDEPYFLRSLIMTHLYISELDTNPKWNLDWSQKLFKMQRIVLQITNLVQVFTSEHCFTTDNGIENPDQYKWLNFNKFLNGVVSPNVALQYYYDTLIDRYMLSRCVVSPIKELGDNFNKFCLAFSTKSKVIKTELNGETSLIRIKELHKLIRDTYDMNDIFEYMLIVYKVLLKLIYKQSNKLYIYDNMKISLDTLKNIINKLQKMNCPIEMIGHFEFLLKIKAKRISSGLAEYRLDGTVASLNLMKLNSLSYLLIDFDLNGLLMSLPNFMDTILGPQFREFWSVFNVLYRESETRSNRVYDLSLHLFPNGVDSVLNNENEIKCNALINIYINWLKIESANNKSLIATLDIIKERTEKTPVKLVETTITEHFMCIRDRYTKFSQYLLDTFDDETAVEYLKSDDDLLNIIINAIIYLKNESNTDVKVETIRVSKTSDLVKLMNDKHEILNRMGHIIMDFLDNYQFRNCKDINDRDSIREKSCTIDENLMAINFDKTENNTKSVQPQGDQKMNLYDLKKIPRDFYDMSLLTSKDKMDDLRIFGRNIHFDWQCDKRDIREIQIEVTDNMLNIRNLVEYQGIYMKGTFLYLLEKIIALTPTDSCSNELTDILANYYTLTVSEKICKLLYSSNSVVVFAFYKVLNNIYKNEVPVLYGMDIDCPKSNRLELIQVMEGNSELESNNNINDEMFDVCSTILSSTSEIKRMISKNAIFFNQSLPSFKFIIPNY